MMDATVFFCIFDEFNRFSDIVILKQNEFSELTDGKCCDDIEINKTSLTKKKFVAVFKVDGYFLSVFTRHLNISPVYSKMVINHFLKNLKCNSSVSKIIVKFQLIQPKREIIDYAWNDRLCYLLVERQELENAMSWLSTLGGAFSALGDSFEKCAKVAAKISLQQFKIAYRLGEPHLVARCKLYMSLSLIQLGKLGTARNLIQEQYQLAKNCNDVRLQNICKGIWAKLQYIYKQKKVNNKKQKL